MERQMSKEVRIGHGLSDQRWILSNSFLAGMSRPNLRKTPPVKWTMEPSEKRVVRKLDCHLHLMSWCKE
jgi:hypothetical protein